MSNPEETEDIFRVTLDAILRSHGLTARGLARRLTCSATTVGHWRSGKYPPKEKDIYQIARILRLEQSVAINLFAAAGYQVDSNFLTKTTISLYEDTTTKIAYYLSEWAKIHKSTYQFLPHLIGFNDDLLNNIEITERTLDIITNKWFKTHRSSFRLLLLTFNESCSLDQDIYTRFTLITSGKHSIDAQVNRLDIDNNNDYNQLCLLIASFINLLEEVLAKSILRIDELAVELKGRCVKC